MGRSWSIRKLWNISVTRGRTVENEACTEIVVVCSGCVDMRGSSSHATPRCTDVCECESLMAFWDPINLAKALKESECANPEQARSNRQHSRFFPSFLIVVMVGPKPQEPVNGDHYAVWPSCKIKAIFMIDGIAICPVLETWEAARDKRWGKQKSSRGYG
jgi:hypothetical protein